MFRHRPEPIVQELYLARCFFSDSIDCGSCRQDKTELLFGCMIGGSFISFYLDEDNILETIDSFHSLY